MIAIDLVFRLAAMLFLIRFFLQASGADFYNPLSQAVVKATDPIARPLRVLMRPYRNLDFASFTAAWLIGVLFFALLFLMQSQTPSVGIVVMGGLVRTLEIALQFYLFSIIIVALASFLAQGAYNPALALLNQLNEPLIAPLRKVIPPFGPLDICPMVVILIIFILQDALARWQWFI